MSRYPYWGILVYLTLVGCIPLPPDPDPELPPETQEGLNTLGMTVNGQIFQARGGGLNNPDVRAILSGNDITIYAYDFIDDEHFILELEFTQYPFSISEQKIFFFHSDLLSLNTEVSTQNPSHQGAGISVNDSSYVQFTKVEDSESILSGTFDFDILTERGTGDTLRIRKGRFDVIVH